MGTSTVGSARVCFTGYAGPQDGGQETALGTAVVCEVQRAAQAKNKTKTQAGCEGRVSGEFV